MDPFKPFRDQINQGSVKDPNQPGNVNVASNEDFKPETEPQGSSEKPRGQIGMASPNSLATTANIGSKHNREDGTPTV